MRKPQPKQEMFENLLAHALAGTGYRIQDQNRASRNPHPVSGLKMKASASATCKYQCRSGAIPCAGPRFFLDIPFEERLAYITEEYGKLPAERLEAAILRIEKRLGGLEAKTP